MMLNTDLCLAYQFNQKHADCMIDTNRNVGKCNRFQRQGEFLFAHNNTCCAWTRFEVLAHKGGDPAPTLQRGDNDFCGINADGGNLRGVCCQGETDDSVGDCDAFNWPKGIMFDEILKLSRNEPHFYNQFITAWFRATMNGFPRSLQKLRSTE